MNHSNALQHRFNCRSYNSRQSIIVLNCINIFECQLYIQLRRGLKEFLTIFLKIYYVFMLWYNMVYHALKLYIYIL